MFTRNSNEKMFRTLHYVKKSLSLYFIFDILDYFQLCSQTDKHTIIHPLFINE